MKDGGEKETEERYIGIRSRKNINLCTQVKSIARRDTFILYTVMQAVLNREWVAIENWRAF